MPTRVSRSRWRYPLRRAVRSGLRWPHSAPTTASASADSSALIIVCSRSRIRSGEVSARASPSRPAGNMRCGHRDVSVRECCGRFTRRITRWPHYCLANEVDDDPGDRATPLSGTQLIGPAQSQAVAGDLPVRDDGIATCTRRGEHPRSGFSIRSTLGGFVRLLCPARIGTPSFKLDDDERGANE